MKSSRRRDTAALAVRACIGDHEEMLARVKAIHWAKDKRFVLKIADRLGRGRGYLRVLDLRPSKRPRTSIDLVGWDQHALAAAWVGHATVLMRIGGRTILTDPVFSNKVGIGLGVMTAGPRRLTAPGVKLKELPTIDMVLLSHAHFDHLDRPTLRRLPKDIPVFTAPHTAELVSDLGFSAVRELGWNESVAFAGLAITAMSCNHWGARTLSDRQRGYNAYLIESAGHRIYFGGDTAFHTGLPKGPIDLAILGIGAYEPWVKAHATPEQALQMAEQMEASYIFPIHHSTFKLGREPIREPIDRLLKASALRAGKTKIAITEIGQLWTAT